jgi:hypothetical protein
MKRSFKKEFKRQFRLAVTAAIGFIIAFSWRNAIFDAFENFTSRFLDLPQGSYINEIFTSIFITLLGVILIFAFSNLLKDQ